MRLAAALLLLLVPSTLVAQTTANDASCDIGVAPAATLLLPYFEVDVTAPPEQAETTIFTITNVGREPQIASVTLWSDWSYPLLTFDVFLTGYDVYSLNLRDLFVTGDLTATGSMQLPAGSRSLGNHANPRHLAEAQRTCVNPPRSLPRAMREELVAALTIGRVPECGGAQIGAIHTRAIGYVTIDLVATCSPLLPTHPDYWSELLYDNVLIGDYAYVSPDRAAGNYATAAPLVHIRAIPEGGPAGERVPNELPYTFYDRLTPAASKKIDRRQPLPSTFAARFIQGGMTESQGGMTGFLTNLRIWRETLIPPSASCAAYRAGGAQAFIESVRFDERENATTWTFAGFNGVMIYSEPSTKAAGRYFSGFSFFPPLISGDIAGWLYLNLSYQTLWDGRTYPPQRQPRRTQNWVTSQLFAEGRYSALADAAWLANGCTRTTLEATGSANPIGPP
jgi:hypothetical protein